LFSFELTFIYLSHLVFDTACSINSATLADETAWPDDLTVARAAVNQDNISGSLRRVRLSESPDVESGRHHPYHGCHQNGSVHLRDFLSISSFS
jgi:hypothetical protein